MNTKKNNKKKGKTSAPISRRIFALILSALALYISTNIWLSLIISLCAVYTAIKVIMEIFVMVKKRKPSDVDKDTLFVYVNYLASEIIFGLSIYLALTVNPLWIIATIGSCIASMIMARWLLKNKKKELLDMQGAIEKKVKKWVSNSILKE